jgi:hypothetical protein
VSRQNPFFEEFEPANILPPIHNRRRKISLENMDKEHQRLIDEAKVKSLPQVAEIEYQETDS